MLVAASACRSLIPPVLLLVKQESQPCVASDGSALGPVVALLHPQALVVIPPVYSERGLHPLASFPPASSWNLLRNVDMLSKHQT